MAQHFVVHPRDPQPRLIRQAAEMLRAGKLAAVPTDSAYALAGHLSDAQILDRIRKIRAVDERHHFTLLCRDLSELATYARVDNAQYRLLKAAMPGPYTFILVGAKELPRRVLHPRKKTIGLRVPSHKVLRALLTELGEPLIASTLILPGEQEPLNDGETIVERLGHALDLVLDAGACPGGATTVLDLSAGDIRLLREGMGSLAALGISVEE
ncbi:MAG: L-threonylcarbamoyladenylate synthase [Rhodocyclaceae bacterium]|nr:L-threonylcarbamoyladenylate synthase [Rhodocyclaceae bacterium]